MIRFSVSASRSTFRRIAPRLAVGVATLAIAFGATVGTSGTAKADDQVNQGDDSIVIGALLPMTGALSSYGETSQVAIQDAVASLHDQGRSVVVYYEDTDSDPKIALQKL